MTFAFISRSGLTWLASVWIDGKLVQAGTSRIRVNGVAIYAFTAKSEKELLKKIATNFPLIPVFRHGANPTS